MDKVLGQEYNGKDRVSFLRDNCDAVEDLDETCPNCQMYCKALQRRITARKSAKNCKYYKSFIKEEKK